MPVNENKIVIDLKGAFRNESYRGVLKDFLAQGLETIVGDRNPTVTGKSISDNHKQITVGYSGPRVDQLALDTVFEVAGLALPAVARTMVQREKATKPDTTTYTIQVAF